MNLRIALAVVLFQLIITAVTLGKPLDFQQEKFAVKVKKLKSGIEVVQAERKGLIYKVVTASSEVEENILQFKQFNDGKKLLSLIYSSGKMVDCDWTKDEGVITNFVREFYSFAGNETAVDSAELSTRKDFKRLKKDCRALQRSRKKRIKKKNRLSRKHTSWKKIKKRKKRPSSVEDGHSKGVFQNRTRGWCKGGEEMDWCCRKHADCEVTVEGHSRGYDLANRRMTKLSHCDCDKSFRECLRSVGSSVSDLAGLLYFNYLQPECFILKPKDKCRKRSWWGHCNKYELIMSGQTLPNAPWNQT